MLLQATPVKSYVGCVGERRDGRINEVPGAVLPILALLAHTHAQVGDLLHHLGQFLRRPRLSTNQLSCASLQRRGVTHKHDVAAVRPNRLENEASDVVHSLVELQVSLVGLEVIDGHLREVRCVHLKPALDQLRRVHEGREPSPAPCQPLKQTVLNADLGPGLLKSLQDGVGRLNAAQSRGGEDVRYPDALLFHPFSCQSRLKETDFSHGGILEEVVWPSFPLRDLLGHVQVASVVVPVRVKGQLDPLLAKSYIHPLSVT